MVTSASLPSTVERILARASSIVIPALTAVANVFLGQTKARYGFMAERRMRTRYAELCREFGVVIPPQARAGLLSVADQQALEIMRGLESNARIMGTRADEAARRELIVQTTVAFHQASRRVRLDR